MFAALCHDLGKIDSTRVEEDGRITSHMHPVSGRPLGRAAACAVSATMPAFCAMWTTWCCNHMRPNAMAMCQSKKKKTRLLFDACVCPEDLILLSRADASGKLDDPYDERLERFLLERLQDWREAAAQPMVTGEDLINAGLVPDERFSAMLKRARELRFAGLSKERALAQVLAEFAAAASAGARRTRRGRFPCPWRSGRAAPPCQGSAFPGAERRESRRGRADRRGRP